MTRTTSERTRDRAAKRAGARELIKSLGGESESGPNFVFGASGLMLSGLAGGWEDCVEWEIGGSTHPPGYHPELVEETIARVRTDLDAFDEAEQAVLENHGYLLADAALRRLIGVLPRRPGIDDLQLCRRWSLQQPPPRRRQPARFGRAKARRGAARPRFPRRLLPRRQTRPAR